MTASSKKLGRGTRARKKAYRPKYDVETQRLAWADKLNAVATEGKPIDPDAAVTLVAGMYQALDALTSGQGLIEHGATLAGEVSLAMRLCERDFAGSGQYLQLTLDARDALDEMGRRHARLGKWGLSGPGLQALRDLIDLREAQLTHEGNTIGLKAEVSREVRRDIERGNCIRFARSQS